MRFGFAARASDVVAFVVTPGVAFGGLVLAAGHEDAQKNSPIDALIVLEAVAINGLVNQVVKFAAGRERVLIRNPHGVVQIAEELNT